jgi:5'-3' exonuclease
MGVKGLKRFLRDLNLITPGSITEYTGQKVVVDLSHFIYVYKSALSNYWLDAVVRLIVAFKKFGIHANPIFDGTPPPEKDQEKAERKEKKNELDGNFFTLKVDMDIYKKTGKITDLLRVSVEKFKKNDKSANKIYKFLKNHDRGSNSADSLDIKAIEEYIAKKEKQIVNITPQEISDLKTLFDLFGIPWIQAPGEAEALGCYLCLHGQAAGIITGDTDVLAYGVPVFISELETGKGSCEVIRQEEVLDHLDLTQEQFVDFCIMCEVDYNKNVKNLGIKTAYKHLGKYGSIEKWHETVPELDISCLRQERCREIFQTFGNLVDESQYKTRYWTTQPNFPKIYAFLNQRNVKFYGQQYWKTTKMVFEDEGEMSEISDDEKEDEDIVNVDSTKEAPTKFKVPTMPVPKELKLLKTSKMPKQSQPIKSSKSKEEPPSKMEDIEEDVDESEVYMDTGTQITKFLK